MAKKKKEEVVVDTTEQDSPKEVARLLAKVEELKNRIDRIVAAIDKSRSVKGM